MTFMPEGKLVANRLERHELVPLPTESESLFREIRKRWITASEIDVSNCIGLWGARKDL